MTMRPSPDVQALCSRRTGLGSVALAGILMLLLGMGAATAQNQRINPRDTRVPEDYRLRSQLQESGLRAVTEASYFNDRPLRCMMELNFSADYPNVEAQSKRIGDPVAALKRVELGFERRGDPFHSDDVHAFVRVRIERVDNGAPLRIERIVIDYRRDPEVGPSSTARWVGEALDAEGYGKISMPVAQMEIDEILSFKFEIVDAVVSMALTLPELGQNRAYAPPNAVTIATVPAFEACACAMENARVSHRSVMSCDAPRYRLRRQR
jgi:hypothetical protein